MVFYCYNAKLDAHSPYGLLISKIIKLTLYMSQY